MDVYVKYANNVLAAGMLLLKGDIKTGALVGVLVRVRVQLQQHWCMYVRMYTSHVAGVDYMHVQSNSEIPGLYVYV